MSSNPSPIGTSFTTCRIKIEPDVHNDLNFTLHTHTSLLVSIDEVVHLQNKFTNKTLLVVPNRITLLTHTWSWITIGYCVKILKKHKLSPQIGGCGNIEIEGSNSCHLIFKGHVWAKWPLYFRFEWSHD